MIMFYVFLILIGSVLGELFNSIRLAIKSKQTNHTNQYISNKLATALFIDIMVLLLYTVLAACSYPDMVITVNSNKNLFMMKLPDTNRVVYNYTKNNTSNQIIRYDIYKNAYDTLSYEDLKTRYLFSEVK